MSKFPEMLKYFRKRSSLTQKQLANNIGVAESTVSMWELGKREPEQENLEALADYFNINLDLLFGREKPATVSDDRLTPSELELIKLTRLVPVEKREDALRAVKAVLRSQSE